MIGTISPGKLLLAVLCLLPSVIPHAQAQLNRNGGSSASANPNEIGWEISFLPDGHCDWARLDRLVGDTLMVIWQRRTVAIPVDSLRLLRHAEGVSTEGFGIVGALAGMMIASTVASPERERNCGHPCFDISPPTEIVAGIVLGLSAGIVLATLLDDANEYIFAGMPYAERMEIVSRLVARNP